MGSATAKNPNSSASGSTNSPTALARALTRALRPEIRKRTPEKLEMLNELDQVPMRYWPRSTRMPRSTPWSCATSGSRHWAPCLERAGETTGPVLRRWRVQRGVRQGRVDVSETCPTLITRISSTADAMDVLRDWEFLAQFDVIHASPLCQAFTSASNRWDRLAHPDLLTPTLELLHAHARVWVVERARCAPAHARTG